VIALAAAAAGAGLALLRRPDPPANVLLITVDTLRADAVGAYGAPGEATPWIDRLAAGGVRFADAHAHNVLTLPSHANILSGRGPQQHGVRDNAGFRFPAGTETLATLLRARGYRTAAFVSAFPLDSRFGLDRGFDVYDDSFADASAPSGFLVQERGGPETVARARAWLDTKDARPWLCWIHLYEPHFPYRPREPWASRFAGNPYRGEVAAADAALQPLLEPLLALGKRGRTLVVLTADHGEALGEHGEATHGIFAYEATLKVPLVLYEPGRTSPRVVTAPASHVDLMPTVLAALGVPAPSGLTGRDLLSPAPAPPTYFEALSGALNRGWAPLRGLIRDGVKYVDLPLPELYDLRADPHETRNLAAQQPQRLAQMRALVPPWGGAVERSAEDADARARLRGLGYVAGAPAPAGRAYSEDDDPKRLIALDALLQDAAARYMEGDLRGALEHCRELVRRRPDMALGWLQLAQLERESANLTAAIDALRRALALAPADTMARALLGSTLTQAGHAGEAVALLEPAVRGGEADPDVLTAYGLALARLRRFDEAQTLFERARAADPTNAQAAVELGTVHMMADDRARARAAFEDALRLNPRAARAHSALAFLAAEEGRVDEAMGRWRSAVALDGRESEKLLALAALLLQRGREDEARAYLRFFVEAAPPAAYGAQVARARAWLEGGPAPAR